VTLRPAALIPAFNEAQSIASVVEGIRPFVNQVIVVDDGSTDETAAAARSAGADVVVHAENSGKGRAIRTGLDRVMAADFTHVLLLDGDMQHLPGEASALLRTAAETGADVVLGERVFRASEMPASRYYANKAGSRVLSWFIGLPASDTQCGFRVFRVEALRGLHLHASGYEIETEMLVKVCRRGGTLARTPITAVYNGQLSKLRPVRDTTRTCFLAVYYRYLERL
jgi:glycosyltransferase involved in cell wall biosynthesis